jgi:EmrB/QacA subfamily drug resistance transporter
MLPVVLSATFMALFDFFVVNVAAPSFQRDLHASQSDLQLIVGGYAFCYATGLVTGGRLGDRYGYRNLFIGGMAGFALASLLCGTAQTPRELIAARLLQGLGGAAMVPQVLSLITTSFLGEERSRAVAYLGAVVGAGSVSGQVVGGLLLQADIFGLGWRAIFLVNVPIGMVAIVLALRLIPDTRAASSPRLDPIGMLAVSVSLALALLPLILGQSEGWPLWTWVSLAASVVAMGLALKWERHLGEAGGDPLVDLHLFRVRAFAAGTAINAAFFAFFGSFMLGITLLLQSGMGLSPLQSGLSFGPLGVAFALTSVAGNRLRARYGNTLVARGPTVSAIGVITILVELLVYGPSISVVGLILPMILIGVGNGMALPSLISEVLSGVDPGRAGAGSGLLTTVQQFSSAAGVALLGVVYFNALGSHPDLAQYVSATARLLILDVALMSVAVGLTRLLPGRPTVRGALARKVGRRRVLQPERVAMSAD